MYIGHYGPALIGASATSTFKLWHGFVGVQLVDMAWAGLIMLDVEKAQIVRLAVFVHKTRMHKLVTTT